MLLTMAAAGAAGAGFAALMRGDSTINSYSLMGDNIVDHVSQSCNHGDTTSDSVTIKNMWFDPPTTCPTTSMNVTNVGVVSNQCLLSSTVEQAYNICNINSATANAKYFSSETVNLKTISLMNVHNLVNQACGGSTDTVQTSLDNVVFKGCHLNVTSLTEYESACSLNNSQQLALTATNQLHAKTKGGMGLLFKLLLLGVLFLVIIILTIITIKMILSHKKSDDKEKSKDKTAETTTTDTTGDTTTTTTSGTTTASTTANQPPKSTTDTIKDMALGSILLAGGGNDNYIYNETESDNSSLNQVHEKDPYGNLFAFAYISIILIVALVALFVYIVKRKK